MTLAANSSMHDVAAVLLDVRGLNASQDTAVLLDVRGLNASQDTAALLDVGESSVRSTLRPPPGASLISMRRPPTALLAAATLILSWGVVEATGSRTIGGFVLAVGGICCIAIWARRHGLRTAAALGGCGLIAFALSHVIALALGAWPAVAIVAAAMAAVAWVKSDAPQRRVHPALSA